MLWRSGSSSEEHSLRFLPLILACSALCACTRFGLTDGQNNLSGDPGAVSLSAFLSGASRVLTPGDPDGRGTARITLHGQRGEVCFEITVVDLDSAIAAHVHEGIAGVAGRVVIPLAPPVDGAVTGCTSGVNPAVMSTIYGTPTDYYIDVHTVPFPDGAVRGQVGH